MWGGGGGGGGNTLLTIKSPWARLNESFIWVKLVYHSFCQNMLYSSSSVSTIVHNDVKQYLCSRTTDIFMYSLVIII